MRISIITLIAAALTPAVAQAQSQREVDRDRREVRQDRREVVRDRARGDYREAREDRRELREDRRETREDVGDRNRAYARDDWRRWRDGHRDVYAGGGWRAPFGYQAFRPGGRIAPAYYGRQYVIADPWRYHLPAARPGLRYVRHYNDVLLVDGSRGTVVDVLRGFYF
jgi:Ni/Co efflux regulator RcnB